jgi:hypothetical protein
MPLTRINNDLMDTEPTPLQKSEPLMHARLLSFYCDIRTPLVPVIAPI